MDRLGRALQQGTDRPCARQALRQLVRDVGSSEIGEDEDVGAARNRASRSLATGDLGIQCGVALQLAVELEIDASSAEQLDRGPDLVHQRVLRAAFRRERQQSDSRLFSQEHAGALGRCDGDVRELLRVGIRDHSAVAVDQLAAVWQDHQKAGRDESMASGHTDRRERDPNRLGRSHLGSHDGAVDHAGRRHQSGEVDRPRGQHGCLLAIFEPSREQGCELLAAARARGVDDLEGRGLEAGALERRDDRRTRAHQDRLTDPLCLGDFRRRQDPGVRRLWKRDARRHPGRKAPLQPRYRIQGTFRPRPRRGSTLPPRLRRSCSRASMRRR